MSKLVAVVRVACAAALFGTLASACGGQSFSGGPGGDSGSAGTGDGGSSNVAGTHSTGGKAHAGSSTGGSAAAGTSSGGTSSAGTGSGGGVTAGAGGAPPDDACSGPASIENGPGGCTAAFMYWTHDSSTGLCKPTYYGGCGGTKNLYKTLDDCQKACPGGTPNYDECKVATDCVLGSAGCCGVCDGPSVTSHDFIAYNKQYAQQVVTCGDVACGACPPPDGEGTIKDFLPNCVQGQCVVEDLRTSPVTACKTASDCHIRAGTGCCPSCDGADLISVRNDGSFENLVCGSQRPPCAACMPSINAVPSCEADGHCGVEYLAAAGQTP